MKKEIGPFEKVTNFIRNSVTLKLITISILTLLLLIPASMVTSLISEREQLNSLAISEVSSKWALSQQINGPLLTIPLHYEFEEDGKIFQSTKYWHTLPENLIINIDLEPQKLRRGIYEVVVYKSGLSVSGDFVLDQPMDRTNLKEIKYDLAFLTIGISDLRGIKNKIDFKWDNQILNVDPGSKISNIVYSGVTIELSHLEAYTSKSIDFEFQLDLQGSQNISFIPIGATTEVNMQSSWKSPSFNGNFLPDSRELNEDGFVANWNILELNRNFPQSWIEMNQSEKMNAAAFGVDLILPLDDYQKSMRSVKYAVMTIALTFLIFFLVEILNKRKIHPFQYTLVGLALCLFYILLISITEHSNFNFAFGISTLGIVSMITLYSLSIFKKKKLTVLLLSTLVGIYGFLFVTLQIVDYALILGSIGLTLILGVTMYFTRNIDWYKINSENE